MDSGCSYHMTPRLDILFDFLECDWGSVQLGDNRECKIRGIYRKNTVEQNQGELNASVEEKDSLAQVWHKRLGHMSEAGLQVLEKQGLFGKKSLGKLDFCENYVLGKSHRVSFGVGRHTTQGVIDYVHSDLWGPSQVESLGGKRYFLSIIDDYSRRVWVYILRFKHEAFGKFKEWKQLVENQTGRTVKKLRTDNGLEFCNREFEQLCIESGIARHLTVAGMPQQNGVAERMNRTLMDKVRCLLIQSGLPKTFWAEATCTAAYLINRSPSRAIEKKTPMEMWSGHPSDYGMLRIFGCVAYPHDKQGDKSVEELQVEVELQRLNNLTPEEDQIDQEDGDDEDAGNHETDQTLDLTDYQLARDRERRTRTKPLRFRDEIACEDSSKWKAAMEEEMDSLRKNKTWELVDYPAGQKLKSLYGLKQSPRQWYRRFDEYMLSNGFKRSSYDSCVYYKSYAPGGYIYLLLYVDDMLISCKSKAEIGSTKSLLKKEFDMKELGEAKKILGMEIVRDRSSKILRVSQFGYVSKILYNFRIDNGKSVKMPLGGHFKLLLKDCLVKDCDVERMSKVPYANTIGSLMYLMVCTRPDIAYAVSVVSRYLANPGKNHWEAVKWILKYLRGTANVGLVYGTNHGNHVDVTGFVDSDYAKDPD
ncbi:retrovirus-related pol polyprotein from transposon TNT 1-94 [Tanacetum coccineum]